MRRIIAIIVLISVFCGFCSCSSEDNHPKAEREPEKPRYKVTLYLPSTSDMPSKLVWYTDYAYVNSNAPICSFREKSSGKRVEISGTIVVEEQ